jgi:hypothetical protein
MAQTALVAEWIRRRVSCIGRTVVPELLVGVGLAANLLAVLLASHFPYQDAPNHLARYVVIERLLWGEGERDYSFHWVPSPYIAVDLVGACLVRLFGPTAAEKVLISIAVALPIIGMYLLLRATAPGRRGWALIAVLISFSWLLMAGLLNFVLGFGLVLCCLAWWWPRRDADGWSTPAVVAGMVFGLFFVHLWAPLFLLVVLGATLIVIIPDLIAGGSPAYMAAIRLPVVRAMLLGTMAFVAAGWWMAAYGEGSFETGTPLLFRNLTSKLLGFVSAFYVFSLKQATLTAASYGALLLIFLAKHGTRPLRDPFFIAAALLTLLYLVFPLAFGPGVSDTDRRWLLLAYYLPFCLVAPKARPERLGILALALLLCLTNTAVVATGIIAIDRQLDDYDAVLRQIPRGSRLLELVTPTGDYTRVSVYGEYGFWHIIRNGGRISTIWSFDMGDRGHPVHLPHLRHFVANWRPYTWDGTAPLDWQRIAADYDYIVLVSEDEALRAEVRAHARQELTVGAVSLYDVVPARAGRSGPKHDP